MITGLPVPVFRSGQMVEVDLVDLTETELALYFRALPKGALEGYAMGLVNLVRNMQPSPLNAAGDFMTLLALNEMEIEPT